MNTVVNVFANLSDLSDIFLFIHFDKIRFVNKNNMLTINESCIIFTFILIIYILILLCLFSIVTFYYQK